ncbi:hypothetical protein AB205_0014510 [Aquarana catesbeiana]|uniref:5-oxoprolinase n=1 Tax=Aquarana catesbeiana TaxID=8400 RepID=A0A2G9R7J0_AQUCT|nr:hypothetical protein AB205_0014510 [Aquarana catesbeiana]
MPDYFPRIFGPSEDQPLSKEETTQKFQQLTAEINQFQHSRPGGGAALSEEEVAMGFIRVANEAMCRPIRSLTQAKGHDTSRHVLACFGGAGGQHACAIARSLGMKTVFIHKYGGILSAFGMALADVVHEAQEPCSVLYSKDSFPLLEERISALEQQCIEALQQQGFHRSQIDTEPFLHLRYERTDCALMCSAKGYPANPESCHAGDFKSAFTARYMKEFGFTIPSRPIVVDDIRVRGTGSTGIRCESRIKPSGQPARIEKVTKCYFEEGYKDTHVYLLEELSCDHTIPGPAIIIDKNSTILVEPDCTASITEYGDVQITVGSGKHQAIGTELDTIQLSIFSHRFMSIAEQMGRILQRTAISTNIKERLDFSCALFGPDGGLVSNAPHIPVHLGAMQETVQFQIRSLQDDLKEGDVILSNHPCAGGSHLPDLTVITPVFRPEAPRPVFFVASRGHHADIGGITPGSMPPHSKSLKEEGAVFISFKLVKEGQFQEKAVTEALMAPGLIPGSSGTRNLHDNLSDLRAQVAANQKGIQLANAEVAVREMLKAFAERWEKQTGALEVESLDFMDDGSPIRLKVQINKEEGSAVFDFSGSGHEVFGNCNAPRAITLSALIYCLRCMVGQDIPLNQGCLVPIKYIIPKGSILDPSPDAAVVGGNVLTSQRIVDVIFKAFQVCAASQGCMNNVTFGNEKIGYYETVAGGAGAGQHWDGRSGIHSHMTNTRITDPEILEKRTSSPFTPPEEADTAIGTKMATPQCLTRIQTAALWSGEVSLTTAWHRKPYDERAGVVTEAGDTRMPPSCWYPVVLKRFELRPGSGGDGRFTGGDGVIRELMFRENVILSVLTERRVFRPYGLNGYCTNLSFSFCPVTAIFYMLISSVFSVGGSPGDAGLNLLHRRDGRTINLGGKTSVPLEPGVG